jgi:multidrug resistance efflux pump
VFAGIAVLAIFLGLLNYLTPSGRVAVGRVVELTPNVAGQIIAIDVQRDVPVKQGDVLFRIDPTPFPSKGPSTQGRTGRCAAARQASGRRSRSGQGGGQGG